MKKLILSLAISCLVMGSDCFAAKQNKALNANQSQRINGLVQVKNIASNGFNAKKALKRKDVQITFGTAAVIGTGAAVYYFVPGVSNFVNSNIKTVIDAIRNSDQYKLVSSKLLEMGRSSKVFKSVESSKFGNVVKNWLGIKPAPTKREKALSYANRAKNRIYKFVMSRVSVRYNIGESMTIFYLLVDPARTFVEAYYGRGTIYRKCGVLVALGLACLL